MKNNKFNFFIPIDLEKGDEKIGELVKIKGICSTDSKDSDGEVLIPSGFDFDPLLKTGFLNWNHQAKSTSKAIVGEPTSAKVINNGKDFYIEGVIYPNEEGRNIVKLAETLQKHSPNRRLGFSIEGQALERDILNPKKVTKAKITGVAITQCPKNPNTLLDIVKGEYDEEFVKLNDDEEKKALKLIATKSNIYFLKQLIQKINEKSKDKKIFSIIIDREKDPIEIIWNGEDVVELIEEDLEGIEKTEVDKAMVVNQDINPPSITGTEDDKKVSKTINKSDIYNQIYNKYTDNFEKADKIYEFINKVKEKHMAIADNKDLINADVLEKSFAILDEAIELDNLKKSKEEKNKEEDYDKKDEILDKEVSKSSEENNDVEIEDEEDDDDDDFSKSMYAESFAKSLFEQGMKKEEVIKAMTKVGVNLTLAETVCSNCIEQANDEKQGGEIVSQSFKKGEDQIEITAGFNDAKLDNLFKSLVDNVGIKLSAVGEILKIVNEKVDFLQKSNDDNAKIIKQIKSTPQGTKSITNSRPLERFSKSKESESNSIVYNRREIGDMENLNEVLFNEAINIKSQGKSDPALEKAISDLEITKSCDFNSIAPTLRRLGVSIQ